MLKKVYLKKLVYKIVFIQITNQILDNLMGDLRVRKIIK